MQALPESCHNCECERGVCKRCGFCPECAFESCFEADGYCHRCVGNVLSWCKDSLDKQQEVIDKLVTACDATTAQWDEATRPGAACEDCPDPQHVAMSREAAAAARAGEGRG